MKPWHRIAQMVAFLATAGVSCAALEWETTEHSLAPAFGEGEVEAVFAFTNIGNEPVTLTQVSASCGCTVPSLSQRTFAPGERGEIRSVYTVGNRQGKNRSVISVHTDAPGANSYTLTLNVDIPIAVQVLPRVVNWRVGESAVEKEIDIVVHPELDAIVTGITGSDENFSAELHPVDNQPGRYRLIITPASTRERTRAAFALEFEPEGHLHQIFALVY